MHSQSFRFTQSRRMVLFASVTAILGGLTLALYGLSRMPQSEGVWMMAIGFAAMLLALIFVAFMEVVTKIEANTQRQHGELLDLRELLDRYGHKLDEIATSVSLSDGAKSIAHREKELDALRKAVRDDIHAHLWDTALYLVAEMQRRFGIEEEAARLRQEVNEARAAVFREKLKQAIDHVEELFKSRDWLRARQEIDRLHRVLPDEPQVTGLYEAMQRHRNNHKQELLDAWADVLRRDDIDGGIELLKELDQYLTREESVSLESSARDVFKRKLLQLRFRFQYAVGEHRWSDALEVGLQIMNEYPNSRMAHEVREKLPVLRLRAGLPAEGSETEVTGPRTPAPAAQTS